MPASGFGVPNFEPCTASIVSIAQHIATLIRTSTAKRFWGEIQKQNKVLSEKMTILNLIFPPEMQRYEEGKIK